MKTYFTVHAVALRNDKKFLILQRAKHRSSPGKWNCITGYVKDRESAEEAAVRELKEETNLEGEIIKTGKPYWVDSKDKRWVIVPSLIKIENAENLKIDKNESQDYKWIHANNVLVEKSVALKKSLTNLELV